MKKISVKNIINFKNKSDKSRKTFIVNLGKEKEADSEGGGDYWVRSMSALSNAVKEKNTQPIKEKIDDIIESFKPDTIKQTKDMYQRNLDVLYNYEDFDINNWLPDGAEILNKANKKSVIEINGIPVQINPNQLYSFTRDNNKYVGGIWFLAKLSGFSKEDLGIFAESLYIFLVRHFEDTHSIDPENCLIVDVLSKEEVNYKLLLDGKIKSSLFNVLDEIKTIK